MNTKEKRTIGEELIGTHQNTKSSDDLSLYDNLVVNHYLKKKLYFYDNDNADDIYKLYDTLFSLIINVSIPNLINKNNNDSLFSVIMRKITESNKVTPIIVKSRAGHGKTEFLSVLYQYLKYQYNNSKFDRFPVYISLHHYNKTVYKYSKRFLKQATDELFSDLSHIFKYLKKMSEIPKILFIIDGPDEFRYNKVDLEEQLLKKLDEEFPHNVQIIGLRQHIDKHKISYRNEINIDAEIEIRLDKISVTSTNFGAFISTFVKIEKLLGLTNDSESLKKYILETIDKLSMKHIDMFHLFLLSKNHREFEYANINTIGGLYERYINKCNIDIGQISAMAFKMYNQPGNISNEEKNTKLWWKLQKHDSLRDFLAAYYIANMLINYSGQASDQDLSIFNYVYPYDINLYCKDIINEDKESEMAAYETIMQLYHKSQITAQTHFCYLLGRFNSHKIREEALKFLLKEEASTFEIIDSKLYTIESLQKSSKQDRRRLLFYRTICISLICLGNAEIPSKYITQMIKNKYLDNLNRGFHLEYYEDITLPLTSQTELLMHDDYLCDFPKTFDRLFSKIKEAVCEEKFYPLFPVELYTLCSLIQHRQECGKYFDKIDEVVNLLEVVKKSNIILPKDLEEYVNLCSLYFHQKEKFRVGSFIKEIYSLKQMGRKGWIKRGIDTPETVASHIWGTLVLAYFYLPTILANHKDYNKDLIVKMLIVHDMGEVYIGDLTPEEKTKKDCKIEAICFNYINLMSTYTAINATDISEFFNMFTYGTDINSCIARDLDKLDNLLQLHIYKEKISDNDFYKFKKNLEESIITEIGKQIRNQILEMFNCQGVDDLKSIIDNYKNQSDI